MRSFGAGVILTLTSSTAPGGYSRPASAEAQFPVYKQDLERAAARLAEDGFEVLFDWRSADLAAFQRGNGTA
jgi:hypothetical protein